MIWRLKCWWRERGHEGKDANCIHWNGRDWSGECAPCRTDGGYVARRHVALDCAIAGCRWGDRRSPLCHEERCATKARLAHLRQRLATEAATPEAS